MRRGFAIVKTELDGVAVDAIENVEVYNGRTTSTTPSAARNESLTFCIAVNPRLPTGERNGGWVHCMGGNDEKREVSITETLAPSPSSSSSRFLVRTFDICDQL